jgi:hypothetical protein
MRCPPSSTCKESLVSEDPAGIRVYVIVCGSISGATRPAAKGAEAVLSLTGPDQVEAQVARELAVSDRQLLTRPSATA